MRITVTLVLTLFTFTLFAQWTHTLNRYRNYDEVSWLITHNAYNNPEINATDAGAGGRNQGKSINQQLNDGVRSFMIDLHHQKVWNHVFSGKFVLGHSKFGAYWHYMDWCNFLTKIKIFLDNNPDEIITLHIEVSDKVTELPGPLENTFFGWGDCGSQSDVSDYIYGGNADPNARFTWPSLHAMIAQNQRLVIFTEKKIPLASPWIRPEFEWTRQNDYAAHQVSELTQGHRYKLNGQGGRGDVRSHKLTINNFCTDSALGYGDWNKSADANQYNKVYDKLIHSWFSFGKRPSIAVDYYEANNYSAMNAINNVNNINEVVGQFMTSNWEIFNGYVMIGSDIEGAHMVFHGTQAMARGNYSLPARPGEPRTIYFWHPKYEFNPSSIDLSQFAGSNEQTTIRNIMVTPKSNPVPIGQVITLKAKANGKFVHRQSNDQLKPTNNGNTNDNTKFLVMNAGGGYISLANLGNGNLLCAENYGNLPIYANRTAVGDWEKFLWIQNSDGSISLKSKANNKYVCAENGGNATLIANRTAIGNWEKFDLFHNYTPTSYGNGWNPLFWKLAEVGDEQEELTTVEPLVTVFPNPVANGQMNIKYELPEDTGNIHFALYDKTGRLVREWQGEGNDAGSYQLSKNINTTAGIYFLRASFGKQVITEKVIFQ